MNRKTVCFDLFSAQPVGNIKFHGGGEYIKSIFKYFVENYHDKNNIIAILDSNKYLDEWIKQLFDKYGIVKINVKSYEEIENRLQTLKIDTLFLGISNAYAMMRIPDSVFCIGVIHGLRYAEKPIDKYAYLYGNTKEKLKSILKILFTKHFRERAEQVYKNIYSRLDYVIVDSKHTFYALQIWLGVDGSNASIFYPPLKEHNNEKNNILLENKIVPLQKYFLLLSANRWEKNSYRTLLAFDNLFQKGMLNGYRVVVCGNVPSLIKRKINNLDSFIFKDYVSDNELECLYKNCHVFVYPTLNEGFGYPPIEAMKYGKTCIVSCVCSLPELCENQVFWTNPYDVKEIQNRILWAINETKNPEQIMQRYTTIKNKQDKDVGILCELISRGNPDFDV